MPHQRDLALSARSFLRPVTSRRIPLNPDLGYWGGVTWGFSTTVTNGTTGTDEVGVTISPGQDNEFDLLYGNMINQAGASEQLDVAVQALDRTIFLGWVAVHTVPNGNHSTFPANGGVAVGAVGRQMEGVSRITISGDMELILRGAAIAVSQDIVFNVVCRVRGDKPTHTIFPADATEVINLDEFF